MYRTTQVFCGSLVVFLLSSYTTAMAPSWLSAVSFKCEGRSENCVGVLIDEQWMLTTASCFQKCNGNSPQRSKVFLNIPEKRHKRKVSLKRGSKVSADDVWIHPSYDSITSANNLALVKLECHDVTLNISADFKNISCSVPMQCSNTTGYLHSSKSRLRSREQHWEIDLEGNVTLSRCSVALGMDTIYYCANQPVAVSSNKMSKCTKQRRIVPATPICHHSEWINSVINDNMAVCTTPTDVPTDMPTSTPDESTVEVTLTPTTPDETSPTDTPISTATPVTFTEPPPVVVEPIVVEPIVVEPIQVVTSQPTEGVTSQPATMSTTSLPANDGCVLKIENGEATVTRNFGTTSVIEYMCNRGYHFSLNVNKQIRICINGNMPSKPLPCEAIACPPFEPIANGRIEVTGLTYSSVARFICDPGYYITGSAIRSCNTEGEWNGIAGICKRKCTVPQSIRCNDGARVYPTKTAFADIGDVVQYSVPNRYALIGSNPVCQPDSTWSPSPDCMKLCDESQDIPNAVVTVNRKVNSYTRKITCSEGYQPDGSDVQRCHFGTWTPIFRSCKRGCSDITLANGRVTVFGNQLAIFECDKGFYLDPPLVLISCKQGTWSPTIPTCVPNQ